MSGCRHIENIRESVDIEIIKKIFKILRKNQKHTCFDCKWPVDKCRLYICLLCAHIGCHGKHSYSHSQGENHFLRVELLNWRINCTACSIDADFEKLEPLLLKKRKKSSKNFVEPWKPLSLKDIMKESRPTVVVRGLANLGNTCYLNVILQALLHTPKLKEYVLSCSHNCLANEKDCFFCLFSSFSVEYFYDDDRFVGNPFQVLFTIWRHHPNFAENNHQDPHELFNSIFLSLHETKNEECDRFDCKCILNSIFLAELESKIVCSSCCTSSKMIEKSHSVSIEISDCETDLVNCLRMFTKEELLDTKIDCQICKCYKLMTKQIGFWTYPEVLVIHLKRFEVSFAKINKKTTAVKFPLELDMSPFLSSQSVDPHVYSLYAIIEHVGNNLNGGHFVCYLRFQDIWFRCSDNVITPVTVDEIFNCKGYMLFYEKKNKMDK